MGTVNRVILTDKLFKFLVELVSTGIFQFSKTVPLAADWDNMAHRHKYRLLASVASLIVGVEGSEIGPKRCCRLEADVTSPILREKERLVMLIKMIREIDSIALVRPRKVLKQWVAQVCERGLVGRSARIRSSNHSLVELCFSNSAWKPSNDRDVKSAHLLVHTIPGFCWREKGTGCGIRGSDRCSHFQRSDYSSRSLKNDNGNR